MNPPEDRASEFRDRVLKPISEQLSFELAKWPGAGSGNPVVLFLGNHSSGKSSFINYLLGQKIQATGLAPTDDGFTLITWGAQIATADGPTVTSHPRLGLEDLAHLGPNFTSKLRVKSIPHDLLRSVTLVDSPGMIDAVGEANTRGYDFPGAVRVFAERADLILFFFDPDKPGTTAESIYVLTSILSGLGYKLMLVLNKVDQFGSSRDFARTYGALCWNLAKAIRTKDIPHIATCYLPADDAAADRRAGGIPLADFDASRAEILDEIKRSPGRRTDHQVTELLRRAQELHLHARVCRELGRAYRRLRLQWLAVLLFIMVLASLAGWYAWPSAPAPTRAAVIAIGVAATAAAAWFGQWQARRFARRSLDVTVLDDAFATACQDELTLNDRADLRALWSDIRDRTIKSLRILGPGRFALSFGLGRQISRLEKAIVRDIPLLRRDLGQQQPELALRPEPTPHPVR